MRLSWKDGATTVLTAAIVTLYAGYLAEAGWPLVSGPRALAGVVLVAGLATCALGAADTRPPTWAARVGGGLGLIAFGCAVFTLITGNAATLAALVAVTVVLWAFATLRHAFTHPAPLAHR